MGSCFSLSFSGSRRRRRNQGEQYGVNSRARRSVGEIHSHPLKPVKPKWKSDIPITDGQLRSKRDEFWETAPAFEGRREIWDALKAAAVALEVGDHSLAQAIIDGANILLPFGTLTDCYDELGNRYQLPVYVLSSPVNLVEEMSGDSENTQELADIQPGGKDILLGIRLSTGKELKLKVNTGESVHHLKRRIFELEGIDPARQRFLFCGHLLVDRDRLTAVKIPKGFMLQVMVVEPITVQSPGDNGGMPAVSPTMLNGNTTDKLESSNAHDNNGSSANVTGVESESANQETSIQLEAVADNVKKSDHDNHNNTNDNSTALSTASLSEALETSTL